MPRIYCGNNMVAPDLASGRKVLGTRYSCMRQGIGVGRNLPYDPDYAVGYEPIVDEKFYCGNKEQLPDGYVRFGSLPQCQAKGVGIGKTIRAKEGPPPQSRKYLFLTMIWLLWFVVTAAVFAFIYYRKPDFVTDERKRIVWSKFASYYAPIVGVTTIIASGISYYAWKN